MDLNDWLLDTHKPFNALSSEGVLTRLEIQVDAACVDLKSRSPYFYEFGCKIAPLAPQVYFFGDNVMNLKPELVMGVKLKCSRCGLKGAALGCYVKSCHRSYHFLCAKEIPKCRWDYEDFLCFVLPILQSSFQVRSLERPILQPSSQMRSLETGYLLMIKCQLKVSSGQVCKND
ncbi:hypothetical protein ES319_A03G086400v1 [Gossypium barbadense]|uniref:PHD-type domain-containing protein n=3 Tax=Gossypium TaxID=3633 RepID=A0A5J5WCW6_GOSBA|nr:hypothetical protein ES319_A03G086400v1 [Gossypium barbadense]TYH24480.1 hypothetical protein ES288_A03G095200v1 [Gossypium darwinii]